MLVLPIPEVLGHQTEPVAAYRLLLTTSSTMSMDQSLLTYLHRVHRTTVMVPMGSGAGDGRLPAGPGPYRHQTSWTVDQQCLLAVHHVILHHHFTARRGTCPCHPHHHCQNTHHRFSCLHLLLLLATPLPLHSVIASSPYVAPPLITTVVIFMCCVTVTLCWASATSLW